MAFRSGCFVIIHEPLIGLAGGSHKARVASAARSIRAGSSERKEVRAGQEERDRDGSSGDTILNSGAHRIREGEMAGSVVPGTPYSIRGPHRRNGRFRGRHTESCLNKYGVPNVVYV